MANYPVSVAFEGEECGFNLTAILLSKIEVTKNPNKRSYQPGEVLNYSGIVVTATYDDQTTANVTSRCIFTPAAGEAFESPVEIVYAEGQDEKSCSLTLAEVSPLRIYIASQPTKTVYHSGETIDYAGLVVKAVYSDDSEVDITSQCSYSSEGGQAFDPDNDTIVEISYLDCSTTLSLTAIILTGISVTSNPTKTAYRSGEAIDYTGLVVTASYSDGSTVNVTSNCTITPRTGKLFDPETDTNVEISYLDSSESATASLVLTAITLTGISVTTNPTKMSYEAGEVIDYSGLVVTASYSDGSTAVVTSSCTITPRAGKLFDPDTDSTAEISYIEDGEEFTATLMLTDVYLVGIEVTSYPTKTAYKHDERIRYAGMVVTASYSDGSTEDVTSKCRISPPAGKRFDEETDSTVTISYGGSECTLALTLITVVAIQVTRSPDKIGYKTGEQIYYGGIIITATYSDNSTDDVSSECTYSAAYGKAFNPETDTNVTVTYVEGDNEVTCTLMLFEVSMSLIVDTMPTIAYYNPGDELVTDGAVIKAVQANNDTHTVTDYCDFEVSDTVGRDTTIVVRCAEPVTPYIFDLNSGYVDNGTWKVENPTRTYIDIYRVTAGHKYLLTLGSDVGSRFRAMFTQYDVSTSSTNVTGTMIINTSNPAAYANVEYTPSSNGYIVIGKDNVGKTGVRTYLYDANATVKSVSTTFTLPSSLVELLVTPPTKVAYEVGENYDYTGVVVSAVYGTGAQEDVTALSTFDPPNGSVVESSDITQVLVYYDRLVGVFDLELGGSESVIEVKLLTTLFSYTSDNWLEEVVINSDPADVHPVQNWGYIPVCYSYRHEFEVFDKNGYWLYDTGLDVEFRYYNLQNKQFETFGGSIALPTPSINRWSLRRNIYVGNTTGDMYVRAETPSTMDDDSHFFLCQIPSALHPYVISVNKPDGHAVQFSATTPITASKIQLTFTIASTNECTYYTLPQQITTWAQKNNTPFAGGPYSFRDWDSYDETLGAYTRSLHFYYLGDKSDEYDDGASRWFRRCYMLLFMTELHPKVRLLLTPPTKILYHNGEVLDFTSMVATAVFPDGSTRDVTSEVTITPAQGNVPSESCDVTVSYTHSYGNGFKYTVERKFHITVVLMQAELEITPPTKTSYQSGEAIDYTGARIIAIYSDDTREDVTSTATFSPSAGTTITGDTTVSVSYTNQWNETATGNITLTLT